VIGRLAHENRLWGAERIRGELLTRVLGALIHLALAALAIAVVRSIVARQRERLRRLETTLARPFTVASGYCPRSHE
jgi:hypothetical protein